MKTPGSCLYHRSPTAFCPKGFCSLNLSAAMRLFGKGLSRDDIEARWLKVRGGRGEYKDSSRQERQDNNAFERQKDSTLKRAEKLVNEGSEYQQHPQNIRPQRDIALQTTLPKRVNRFLRQRQVGSRFTVKEYRVAMECDKDTAYYHVRFMDYAGAVKQVGRLPAGGKGGRPMAYEIVKPKVSRPMSVRRFRHANEPVSNKPGLFNRAAPEEVVARVVQSEVSIGNSVVSENCLTTGWLGKTELSPAPAPAPASVTPASAQAQAPAQAPAQIGAGAGEHVYTRTEADIKPIYTPLLQSSAKPADEPVGSDTAEPVATSPTPYNGAGSNSAARSPVPEHFREAHERDGRIPRFCPDGACPFNENLVFGLIAVSRKDAQSVERRWRGQVNLARGQDSAFDQASSATFERALAQLAECERQSHEQE